MSALDDFASACRHASMATLRFAMLMDKANAAWLRGERNLGLPIDLVKTARHAAEAARYGSQRGEWAPADGELVHVEGWHPGAVFKYVTTDDGSHILRSPKGGVLYETRNRLLPTIRNAGG